MKLTSEEAKQVVALYYANWKSPSRTFRLFNTWAVNNNSATRITKKHVTNAMKRFEQRAILQKDTRRKSSLSQSEEVLHGVVSSLYQHPESSLRITAAEMNLSYSTTQKLAGHTLGLYHYRLILTHALTKWYVWMRASVFCR
jgi:hypothetical protein